MVNGLHGEVPSHEFDDWAETEQASANANTCETGLSDGGVDNAIWAELVKHTLADLVRALVLTDLLAHEEHIWVTSHFVRHGNT